MRVSDYLSIADHWPAFKDNDFVELLSLRFVHVHDHDPRLWSDTRCEMALYEGLANDFKCVQVCTIVTPILGEALPELRASFQDEDVAHF